jgi:uncharacterized membrane protein YcaP (DUF421 family)
VDWAAAGALAYTALVLLTRMIGERPLPKMNAFDLVLTAALSSTLATALLSKDVALAEGVLVFTLLVIQQFAITWLSVHSLTVQLWQKRNRACCCTAAASCPRHCGENA